MSCRRCSARFIHTFLDRVNIARPRASSRRRAGSVQHRARPRLLRLRLSLSPASGDPRRTLFWCGMIWAVANMSTGFAHGLVTLFVARFALGFGEFPTATCAMQY